MKDRHRLRVNILGLGGIQGLNMLLTLVTLPYLTRVFGAAGWGNIVFVLLVVNYLTTFINWGFYLGAAQRISANREDSKKLLEIIASVMTAQLMLTVASISILVLFALFVATSQTSYLYISSITILIGNFLNPSWILQGLEKVWEASFVVFLSKLIALPLIFILIQGVDDSVVYILLNGTASIVIGIFSIFWMTKKGIFEWQFAGVGNAFKVIAEDSRVFFTSIISILNDSIIPLSLGLTGGSAELGLFNIADRIKGACIALFNPILHAITPRIAYLSSSKQAGISNILKTSFLVTFGVATVLGLVIFAYATQIIEFIGGANFEGAIEMLQLLSPIPTISALSALIVYSVLIPLRHKNYYFSSSLLGLLITLVIIYPSLYFFPTNGAAVALLVSDLARFLLLLACMWFLRSSIASGDNL